MHFETISYLFFDRCLTLLISFKRYSFIKITYVTCIQILFEGLAISSNEYIVRCMGWVSNS